MYWWSRIYNFVTYICDVPPSPTSRFSSHKSFLPVTLIVSPVFASRTGHPQQRDRRQHNGETSKDQ